MRRRQFLFNSGILATAMVASPSAIWAGDQHGNTALLIIHDTLGRNNDIISSVLKKSSPQVIHELFQEQVNTLSYSSDGFIVTTDNGNEYKAGKVIFSSYKQVIVSGSSITIKTKNKNIHLDHGISDNKGASVPEYWALTAHRFGNGKIEAFVRRKKHAFLCISQSVAETM